VIVGAGITGAITAYLFSKAGVDVVVVDAHRVGAGSTSASTALLMQEPDKDFSELASRYGRRDAKEIWKSLIAATRELAREIRRLAIDCDFHQRESIYFTLDKRKMGRLEREMRARRRAGLPGRWLAGAALPRRTGIRGAAAIATAGNAQVDPVKACQGFIKASVKSGARVFESSPVRTITVDKSGVHVKFARGGIRAQQVIVATGYATSMFKRLAGRFRMKDTFVIATRPLLKGDTSIRRKVMLWDMERPYHYVRWTADSRLILGGEDLTHRRGSLTPARMKKGRERLSGFLARLDPNLVDEKPEYAWQGLFAETPDGLPYIGTHRQYPRHLFALGYGGNGITASFLAAQLLLKRYRNRPDPKERLFAFNRARKAH